MIARVDRASWRRLGGLLLLATLLLAGCAEVPLVAKRSRVDGFDAAIKAYGKLLRWGYFEEATKVLRARDGSEVDVDLARVARYRITRYEVASKLVDDTGREGRVLALVEYYDVDTGVVQSLRDEQLWWHDAASERWYLGSPLPAFGQSGR